ncbi:unnamed protein product [Chrysodeixis includens]|uniref:Uncharacterized protein n=1 Tax=Chrysodeixis includens TaxID=689277 RepID=A0A9P0BPQ2_CHRIL|nr:unnamed protein product [Chrysodeixis includens]
MGSVKKWSTKEEVLKDLAKASGRRIGNLDDGYLVVGDGPPPIIVPDEDYEMQLMFGEAAVNGRKSLPTGNESPDLLGIQQMLQMVKDYSEDEEETMTEANFTDCVISITKVSNLNPCVDEFIPKNDQLNRQISHSPDNNVSTNPNVVTQANEKKAEVVEKDSNVESSNKGTDLNANNVKTDELKEIATELKNKISDAAKSDTFEFKKQKNVAIATLLRLYANNKSPSNETDKGIKLIKPDFFKSTHPASSSSTSTPEPKDNTTSIPSGSSASLSSTPVQTPLENNSNTSKTKLDPEIRNSIEKVNNWLEKPSKKNSKPVYLGPIAFKRKDVSPSPSPPVGETTSSPKRNICQDKQQYKPSTYASDLGKKYMERNKMLEAKQNEVTWANLESVLKKKDKLIKKRSREPQHEMSDSSCE